MTLPTIKELKCALYASLLKLDADDLTDNEVKLLFALMNDEQVIERQEERIKQSEKIISYPGGSPNLKKNR